MHHGPRHSVPYAVAFTLSIGVLAIGCHDPAKTVEPVAAQVAAPLPNMLVHRPGIERDFLDIARRVPAFAGIALDSANTVALVFISEQEGTPKALAEARQLLARLHQQTPSRFRGTVPIVQAMPARFGFGELNRWRDVVSNHANVPGLDTWGIDVRLNRILVGVRSERDVAPVTEHLGGLGIPPAVLRVEVMSPPVLSSTLQDRFAAAVPGLKITSAAGAACTLGINAYDEIGERYFLTASHCTRIWLAPDGVSFSQPTSGYGVLGNEALDPVGIAGDGANGCPNGAYCRWSDVAAVKYAGAAPWKFSWIAKPSSGITFSDYEPIVGAMLTDPIQGENFTRIGMTSGLAIGQVLLASVAVIDTVGGRVGAIFGATKVSAPAREGDSGGPVFWESHVYVWPDRATIAGVEFASTQDGTNYYFSSLSSIAADFLQPWTFFGVRVTLSGPQLIYRDGTYTWAATAEGGSGYAYQWEKSLDGGNSWVTVGSAQTYQESFYNIQAKARSTFMLRVKASTGSAPGQTGTSDAITVTISGLV